MLKNDEQKSVTMEKLDIASHNKKGRVRGKFTLPPNICIHSPVLQNTSVYIRQWSLFIDGLAVARSRPHC